jgi:capsular polysaccharide biosynthesis protein
MEILPASGAGGKRDGGHPIVSQIELTPSGGPASAPDDMAGFFDQPARGPADDWQRRVARSLWTKPRLAIVLGLIVALVVAAAGGLSVMKGPTTYSSTAVMLIDDPPALATAGDDGVLLKLDALRLKYQALVSTDLIAQPVAAELHMPVGDVLGSVSAVVPYQSLLMDVTGTWSTPAIAQSLAQATANEVTKFVKYESDVYNIPANDRYTFIVIDPATSATASKPSHAHALTLAVGLAVAGFAVTFVATQFWRQRRYLFQTS